MPAKGTVTGCFPRSDLPGAFVPGVLCLWVRDVGPVFLLPIHPNSISLQSEVLFGLGVGVFCCDMFTCIQEFLASSRLPLDWGNNLIIGISCCLCSCGV